MEEGPLKLIICIVLLSLSLELNAQTIKISEGKISLIDLGSLMVSKPILSDPNLFKVYELSALENEEHKNILAIQGLKSSGEGDLSVKTSSGFEQFHLLLNKEPNDLVADLINSKLKVQTEILHMEPNRSTLIKVSEPINEYVLCGNPNLLQIKHVVDYYDADFLKVFLLNANSYEGETDIVIPTARAAYKLKVKIHKGANHETNISLN